MARFTDFIPMQKELRQTKADLADAHAKIERLTKERDEARAQMAIAWIAVGAGKGGCGLPCGYDCNGACFALTPAHAKAALEAYGREKVREGMQRAADLCKPAKAKMDWGNKWEPARKNPQSAAAQGARKQCYNAILAAMEKEGEK